jgi:hypothetical protein
MQADHGDGTDCCRRDYKLLTQFKKLLVFKKLVKFRAVEVSLALFSVEAIIIIISNQVVKTVHQTEARNMYYQSEPSFTNLSTICMRGFTL